MKKIVAVALMGLALCIPVSAQVQQTQSSQSAFWETGNAFLSHCDENNAVDFAQFSAKDKQEWILICDFWIMGVRQGIEMTQQIRPEQPTSSAQQAYNSELNKYLESLGIKPGFSTPTENMCIPEDITVNQLRLVVVQWMKANPTTLSEHGAWLVYAALTNTYRCPSARVELPKTQSPNIAPDKVSSWCQQHPGETVLVNGVSSNYSMKCSGK